MKRIVKDYLYLVLIAGLVVFLDQLTKALVVNNLAIGETWMPLEWLAPYARVLHWYNTGVAFGMFQNANLFFAVLGAVVAVVILFFYSRVPSEDWSLRLAMCLQLGGDLGNLIDRIRLGHVTDFVSVGTFPVLNLADCSISLGVAVLILGLWLQEKQNKKLIVEENSSTINQESDHEIEQ